MNVAIISHLYPNQRYPGKGTFIRSLHDAISKRASVEMIVPTVYSFPYTEKWDYTHAEFLTANEATRVRYLSFPRGRFPKITTASLSRAITRHISKSNYDLVHVNWLYPDGLAIPKIKSLGIPCVLSIHGSDWYLTQENPEHSNLVRMSLFQSDAILTVGTRLKKNILKVYPELDGRIHVTYNPVDFNKFQPDMSRDSALRTTGWDPRKKHILCVANIISVKGVDLLLEAFRGLADKNVILHIIGNVPDTPYSRSILELIGKTRNVELHAPVSHDEIIPYYHSCDFLVLPSRREGFGLCLAEAIACGKPVIATNSGGPEDIVRKENGFLVPTEDEHALREKMELLLSEPFPYNPKQISMSIQDSFSEKRVTDHLERIYRSALTNTSRP